MMTPYKPVGARDCFGYWASTAKECSGGLDPAYKDPITGSHERGQCKYYAACAQATNMAKMESSAQVQPLPKPAPQYPITQQFPYAVQRPQQQYPQPQYFQQQQYFQPQQFSTPQFAPPWIAQQGPQIVPMPYAQPGGQIPSYLSVPEPVNPNEHWFGRLLREIVRAIFKSSGHTTANFFDHNPFRPYPTPELPAQNAPDKKGS